MFRHRDQPDSHAAQGPAAKRSGVAHDHDPHKWISALVNDIQRDTEATIGAAATAATPAAAAKILASSISVTATTTGVIVGLGVAGTFNSGTSSVNYDAANDLRESPDDPQDGVALLSLFEEDSSVPTPDETTSGIGVAGSALVDVITDTTLATVNADGTINADTVTVTATNDQTEVLLSGGVAIALAGPRESGAKNVAGAFALNLVTDDTEAHIDGANVTGLSGGTATAPALDVSASRDGAMVVLTAALSADTTAGGKDFAGSVSINRIVDTTDAGIDSANINEANNQADAYGVVSALNDAQIIAIGGAASVTAGAVGFSGSIGFNQISAQTDAEITGANKRSSVTLGTLSIAAWNNNLISAIAVSAGIQGGATGTAAVAFTLGINIIGSSPSVFSTGNGDGIIATIQNSTVTLTGALTMLARDNSAIQSIAGALAIGNDAAAAGVGLSWNEVLLNIETTVDDASVTAGSVSMVSVSTQNAGLLHGKISAAAVSGAASVGSSAVVDDHAGAGRGADANALATDRQTSRDRRDRRVIG